MKNAENQAIKNIIQFIVDSDFNGNRALFCSKNGLQTSNVAAIFTGKLNPSKNLIKLVIENYSANPAYIYGQSDMMFVDKNGRSSELIVKDPTPSYGRKPVPIYNVLATAGEVSQLDDFPELIVGYIDLPNYKKCVAFVKVSGDSMYPVYKAGDLIGLETQESMEIIQYGQAFLIITNDGQKLLKYVRRGSTKAEVVLRSENPKYDDIDVKLEFIIRLFRVHGPIRDDWQ